MTKRKGSSSERELVHLFWKNNWSAIRVAGSGSSRYPSPDVIASNVLRKLAIECKSTKYEYKYIPKHEIKQLKEFSKLFGAEAWIGMRFNKQEWYFLNLEDLRETNSSFMINKEIIENKGITLNELINFNIENNT